MRRRTTTLLTALAALGGCASTGLHPQAPPRGGLATVPDPTPSRVVVHASLSGAALQQLAEQKLPPSGSGDVSLVGKRVHYRWERKPVEVQFDRGRVLLTTRVVGHVQLFGDQTFPVEVTSAGEPVVTPDYQARLQSTTVEVKAQGPLDAINHAIETRIHDLVAARLKQIKVDLKPIVAAAYARLAKPISLVEKRSFYGTGACAELKVAAVEAGPTVLADGIEKDLAVVVLPSVTMPCAADANAGRTLPRLANVAALPSGPFEVTIPISATYDEFARALDNAIGGKLQFSRRYPDTFLEKPEVYPSNDALVIKFLVGGFVRVAGFTHYVNGEVYFTGHPRVIDNQVMLPDLQMTPGTVDTLVGWKMSVDHDRFLELAKSKLRIDLVERLRLVQDKLSTELSFAEGRSCMRGEVLRMEVAGVYPHASFARVYVKVNAQASLSMPCKP